MLTVHHLNNSRSFRILWLLEELGLDYGCVVHLRDAETQRSPASLIAIHPLGKAPAIEHDGRLVTESGAIIEYLTRRLADGRLSHGPESPLFGEYLQWLDFAEGSLMPPLVFDLIDHWTGGGNEALKGFYDAEIRRHQRYMENALATRDYFVGDAFSAADVNIAWSLEMAEVRGRMQGCPRLAAYLARMRARPAFRRALARGEAEDLSVFGAGAS